MDLKKLNVQELGTKEVKEIEGGLLPLLAIYGCWAAMGGCCAITGGIYLGFHNTK